MTVTIESPPPPPFFGIFDIMGLYYPDTKISGKFEIIRVDIPILAHALLTINIFDRIEVYCQSLTLREAVCCFDFISRVYRYEDRAK